MKLYITILLAFLISGTSAQSFYELNAKTINGTDFNFSDLKGKKVMIVNTASKCGFTPQYEDLQKLYEKYKDQNFVIIGFPANDFMKQEPGTDSEIADFCQKNYGVTFQMMSKITVKDKDMHPVYQWLTQKSKNRFSDSNVKWNFQKYLIDEKGNLTAVHSPKTKPFDEAIIKFIEE